MLPVNSITQALSNSQEKLESCTEDTDILNKNKSYFPITSHFSRPRNNKGSLIKRRRQQERMCVLVASLLCRSMQGAAPRLDWVFCGDPREMRTNWPCEEREFEPR